MLILRSQIDSVHCRLHRLSQESESTIPKFCLTCTISSSFKRGDYIINILAHFHRHVPQLAINITVS